MVAEQRETVQRIDADTHDIMSNVSGAQRELLKYYASISSNRWLMLKIFGVLIVFVGCLLVRQVSANVSAVPRFHSHFMILPTFVPYLWDFYNGPQYDSILCYSKLSDYPTGIALTPVPKALKFCGFPFPLPRFRCCPSSSPGMDHVLATVGFCSIPDVAE